MIMIVRFALSVLQVFYPSFTDQYSHTLGYSMLAVLASFLISLPGCPVYHLDTHPEPESTKNMEESPLVKKQDVRY